MAVCIGFRLASVDESFSLLRVSLFVSGLKSCCPRCGLTPLFEGFLKVRERCGQCGLDLRAQDSGDGSAPFIILIVGSTIVGAALIIEVRYQPPIWLHLVLWLPLTLAGHLALLRHSKQR